MKVLVTFALLALFAITGEAATSAWDDWAINPNGNYTLFQASAAPDPTTDEDDFTLIIVGPDPEIPPLSPLEEIEVELVRPGDPTPEPTSGLLLLVGAALLALRRRNGDWGAV